MNNLRPVDRIKAAFARIVGREPFLVRSPGRINLIGEHTDYNDGLVLPASIDRAIFLALSARNDNMCRIHAVDLPESFECTIDSLQRSDKGWPNYILGVVDQMRKTGHEFKGFDCIFGGDVPIGAGMSSSAAVEAGFAFALNQLFELGIPKIELARIARLAENEFVGVQCGIMDQFASLFGEEGKVIKLDCRNLEYEYYPFAKDLRIVVCDSRVRRQLASSEYNVRKKECEAGVAVLRKHYPNVRSLRDVTLTMLDEHRRELGLVVHKRCGYVVRENMRVELGCGDLRREAYDSFGNRMFDSHKGLRDEYEVSCEELDFLVDIASRIDGVFGARMMGAGFGGCTVNLVSDVHLAEFTTVVQREYKLRTGKDTLVYPCSITDGTARVVVEEFMR